MNKPISIDLIKNSLEKGISYQDYRAHLKAILADNKINTQASTDVMLNYTALNDSRMDRLDKTLKLSPESQMAIAQLKNNFSFLVISEGWCGDAAQILPVLNKIAESSNKIDLKIVFRDENEALMNNFLTNGSKSIPIIIIVDSNNQVVSSWGPRPSIATKMVMDYKEKNGALDDVFKKDLQLWYNKDKGLNTQAEIIGLLQAI